MDLYTIHSDLMVVHSVSVIPIADFGCLLEADTAHMFLIYPLIATPGGATAPRIGIHRKKTVCL